MLTPVLNIRNTLLSAVDDYFRSASFYEVSPPILTPLSCEVACVGGSDLISVNYYGQKAYLSQSGQLYLESLALQLGQVYCIAPAFRAESTLLATHLTEFWMCEAEMLNVSFDELAQVAQGLLITIIRTVLRKHTLEMVSLGSNVIAFEKIVIEGFTQVTYTQAINILHSEGFSINWGDDIQPQHESVLSKYFCDSPLFITFYPKSLSSFYKAASTDNPEISLSFDVVAPHGFRELIGGSIREVDGAKIQDSLKRACVGLDPYDWYIKMISTTPTPHGGFGLGIERMVSWLCNLETIQEAIPFPRTENIIGP